MKEIAFVEAYATEAEARHAGQGYKVMIQPHHIESVRFLNGVALITMVSGDIIFMSWSGAAAAVLSRLGMREFDDR